MSDPTKMVQFSGHQKYALKLAIIVCMIVLAGCIPAQQYENDWSSVLPPKTVVEVGGDQNRPPYQYLQNGQPAGFDVELLNAIAAEKGWTLNYHMTTAGNAYRLYQDAQVDMLVGVSVTDAQISRSSLSDAYLQLPYDLFVRLDSPVKSMQDLNGKTVLVEINGPGVAYLQSMGVQIHLVLVQDASDALQLLSSGKYDAALLNREVGKYYLGQLGLFDLKPLDLDLFKVPYGFAVSGKNPQLLTELNQSLQKLQEDGSYNKLYQHWFNPGVEVSNNVLFKYFSIALWAVALLLLGSLAWSWVLSRQVARRTRDLSLSERRYRILVENASEGILLYRHGEIVFTNQQAEQILGYSRDELLKMDFRDLLPPDEWDRMWADFKTELLKGKKAPRYYSMRVLTKSGEIRWLQVNSVDIDWEEEPVSMDLFYDITVQHQSEEALRFSEDKFSKVFHTSPDAIAIHRFSDGLIVDVNQGFTSMSGYSVEEVLGKKNIPSHLWENETERKNLEQQLKANGMVKDLEFSFRVKSGAVRVGSMSARLMDVNGETCILSISRDVTERKLSEERINRQIKYMAALRTVDLAMTTGAGLNFTLQLLLEKLREQLQVQAAAIGRYYPETKRLEYVVADGFQGIDLQFLNNNLTKGYARQVVRRGFTLQRSANPDHPDQWLSMPELANEGLVTYFGLPLITKGEVLGVLEVYDTQPLQLDNEWMNFLEAMAGSATIAIENAGLIVDLEQANTNLIHAYDATIQGWARALELRDGETEGHSQRVTEMVVRLARRMGVKKEELVHVRRGSLLHDIGKMGIPDQILLKGQDLTPEEWKIMRRHPVYGYEMLSSVDFLLPALDIPYCHHERWDGTGYPRGLKGEEIPLYSRIFTVVDVWDALRTNRPYRAAWPREEVYQYLLQEGGKQFDPDVVKAFLPLGFPEKFETKHKKI
jgi:PAS domain S-box-containing protein